MSDERSELEALRLRVRALEDTVHYLSNTLALHGVITQTEAGAARDMYNRVSREER